MTQPTFQAERKLWKKGYKRVACLDESGRGPLAGPVVAAAVMIKNPKFDHSPFPMGWVAQPLLKGCGEIRNPKQILNSKHVSNFDIRVSNLKLRDSKKLTAKAREKFYKILTRHPGIWWGIGKVSEKVIDKINIKNAAELAMEKALKNLEKKMRKKADFLIIDGNHVKNKKLKIKNSKLIIKADEKVFSCALASIIAKVFRDRIMRRCHKKYPHYGFDKHKGYFTRFHRASLKKYGPCEIHRMSFKPVAKMQKVGTIQN